MLKKLIRDRKGAALVEYGLLVGGVALVTAAAVAIFGHKTNDLIATTAAVLPGAHADDNGPILSGKIIETTSAEGGGSIALDTGTIFTNSGTSRLATNIGSDPNELTSLVVETGEDE